MEDDLQSGDYPSELAGPGHYGPFSNKKIFHHKKFHGWKNVVRDNDEKGVNGINNIAPPELPSSPFTRIPMIVVSMMATNSTEYMRVEGL